MNKRTLQEIFDVVIDAGLYPFNFKRGFKGSNYMCNALKLAREANIITTKEYMRADNSIHKYFKKLVPDSWYGSSLGNIWWEAGIIKEWNPLDIDHLIPRFLACYKDWTNRPYAHRALKAKNK